jgi:predicted glutamine amidotransferase
LVYQPANLSPVVPKNPDPSWGDNEATKQTESNSSLLTHVRKRCVSEV